MVPLLLGAAIALARAWRARDRVRLILGGVAAALMVAVAAMTQAGFAGNLRYVALPAALVCVLAGAGWVELVRDAGARFGRARGAAVAVLLAAAAAPFVVADVDKLRFDLDVVRAESELYDRLPPIVAKAGGAAALLRCGPVYAPPFEVQAVAWAMHVHSSQVGIFANPPGTVLAGHFSALGHDPRFPEINKNRRWIVGRNCNGL
jgi:4-amino-4-deoxy-L-arabinose transferase-like glycosyltransferase